MLRTTAPVSIIEIAQIERTEKAREQRLATMLVDLAACRRVDRYRLAVAPETPPPCVFLRSHTTIYYGGSQSEKAKDDGMPSGSSKKRPTSNKKKRQQQRGDTKKQPRQKIPSLEEILAKAEASLRCSHSKVIINCFFSEFGGFLPNLVFF